MTKQEVQAWREQWKLVADAQRRERQAATLDDKLRQFEMLRQWARQMGWEQSLGSGDDEVRRRWSRLKQAHGG